MTTPPSKHLDELSLGFRDRPLSYDELTRQVRSWADAFPDLCRLQSIGRTPEGRDLWLLTLGPEPDRARPSAWVDGNMHASELAGSCVALAIAEDVLRLHLDPGANAGRRRTLRRRCSARARRALLRAAADVARRRRDRAHQGPLRALDPARRAPGEGARVLARRGRRRRRPCAVDARARRGRRDGRVRRDPGLHAAADHRRSAAVLQDLSRGRHREFRWPQRSVAVLPVRQPDGPQPEFPVRVGARFQAGGRGGVPALRDGVACRRGLRDPAPRDLPLAQPAHVRRRLHPSAR